MVDNGDLNCAICFDPLRDKAIGATNPCGHCFHMVCFQGWRNSQRSSRGNVKCPMCNRITSSFVKIYLNLDQTDDPDNISLSSMSDIEDIEEGNEKDVGEDVTTDDTERGAERAHGETENDEATELDEAVPVNFPSVIEIPNDDETVDAATLRENTSSLKPCKGVSKGGGSNDDDADESKIRRKAKRLKRRVKQLEVQRKELLEKEQKYMTSNRELQERLGGIDDEIAELKTVAHEQRLELDGASLKFTREKRLREEAEVRLKETNHRASVAEKQLGELRTAHQRELKKVQAESMTEVKEMLDQHPKLVQQNHTLKREVSSKSSQIKELTKKLVSIKGKVHQQVDNKATNIRREAVQKRKQVVKDFGDAKRAEMKLEQDNHSRKQTQARVHNRMASKLSNQAARMARAANPSARRSTLDALAMGPGNQKRGNLPKENKKPPHNATFLSVAVKKQKTKREPLPLDQSKKRKVLANHDIRSLL